MEHAISHTVGLSWLAQPRHIYPALDQWAVSCCAIVSPGWQPEEDFCMLRPVEGRPVGQVRHIAVQVAAHIAGRLVVVEDTAGHLGAVEDTVQVVPKDKAVSGYNHTTSGNSMSEKTNEAVS